MNRAKYWAEVRNERHFEKSFFISPNIETSIFSLENDDIL